MKNEEHQLIKSNDLGLCGSLIAIGFNYKDIVIEKNKDKDVVFFIFVSSGEELEMIVQQYWNKNLEVDAFTYYTAVKSLKHVIYNTLYK